MKVYAVKGYCEYPEKIFATIEEAKKYALEIIKREEKRFYTVECKWVSGISFKTEISSNNKRVVLNKYWFNPYVNEWIKQGFSRSIREKEFIG